MLDSAAMSTIQTITTTSRSGWDRGAIRAGLFERAREAEPRLGHDHRDEDREAGHRVVHEADLRDAAQARVDERDRGHPVGALGPGGHGAVDGGQGTG